MPDAYLPLTGGRRFRMGMPVAKRYQMVCAHIFNCGKLFLRVHGKMLIGVIHIFQKVHLLDDLFVSVFGACNQTTCLFRKVFLA